MILTQFASYLAHMDALQICGAFGCNRCLRFGDRADLVVPQQAVITARTMFSARECLFPRFFCLRVRNPWDSAGDPAAAPLGNNRCFPAGGAALGAVNLNAPTAHVGW